MWNPFKKKLKAEFTRSGEKIEAFAFMPVEAMANSEMEILVRMRAKDLPLEALIGLGAAGRIVVPATPNNLACLSEWPAAKE